MSNVIYIAHCLHSGTDMDYEYTLELDERFHALPNLYAISVAKAEGSQREVGATILVKTNMGQTKDEIGRIYAAMVEFIPILHGLPLQEVTLRSTKIKISVGWVPEEDYLVQLFQNIYTLNSVRGSA